MEGATIYRVATILFLFDRFLGCFKLPFQMFILKFSGTEHFHENESTYWESVFESPGYKLDSFNCNEAHMIIY